MAGSTAAAVAHHHHHQHHHPNHGLHHGEPALVHDCRHALDVLHGLLDAGPDASKAHADLQSSKV